MPNYTDLDIRMKQYYENIPKTKLMRRCPVIIRIDGRSFHTFASKFKHLFDDILIKTMQDTTRYLCENIQGCVLGYTQSDEITLVLVDYKKFTSAAWFDYEVEKLCSISASMATKAFNKAFVKNVYESFKDKITDTEFVAAMLYGEYPEHIDKELFVYLEAVYKGAETDSRCFNIPKEEVTNCVYWRQDDASKNSIQMVGQANFSHSELQHKSRNDIQDMLMTQKDINWNDFPVYQKRGSCCIKEEYWIDKNNGAEFGEGYSEVLNRKGGAEDAVKRSRWVIDKNIPIFKGEDRKYIDDLVYVGE